MRAFVGLLTLCMALFVHAELTSAEPRVALVIGNGAYSASPLSNPPNDAVLIAKTLRTLGFDVIERTNVDQKTMKTLFRQFGDRIRANKDATGVFYYSGHGMQVGGRNYMIPIGATVKDENDVRIEGIEVNEVLMWMESAGNAMNFVFLDACRDNPFEKSFKSTANGLTRMEGPKGSLIAFAAQPNKVALQGQGDYSYFTEALAEEMEKPDVSISDMLLSVRIKVVERTGRKQVPVEENQLLAKFYFNPKPPGRVEALRFIETPKIQTFDLPKIQTYEYPKIQTFDLPKIQTYEYPKIQTFDLPKIQMYEYPKIQTFDLPKVYELPKIQPLEPLPKIQK